MQLATFPTLKAWVRALGKSGPASSLVERCPDFASRKTSVIREIRAGKALCLCLITPIQITCKIYIEAIKRQEHCILDELAGDQL
jgi:hypothetical protein